MPRVLDPRRPASSVEELVEGATERTPMKTGDSLSGSRFERVRIEGKSYVLKYLHVDDDWIQRVTGDVIPRPVVMWSSGLLDALPSCLDHTIEGIAYGLDRNGWGAAVLMRDVGPRLVPEGDGKLPLEQHLRFMDHMADLHAAFWEWEDIVGLMPMGNRYFMLSPAMAETEAALGGHDPVPGLVPEGWRRLRAAAPRAADIVEPLLADPQPLVDAFAGTPFTLVHSDWKAGNLGSHPDGRTILIDWAFPGRAPPAIDIAWYVAVNCERLPQSKEATIEAYRSALERREIDTGGWWQRQLELALLGAFVLLGWSKQGAELEWWEQRIARSVALL